MTKPKTASAALDLHQDNIHLERISMRDCQISRPKTWLVGRHGGGLSRVTPSGMDMHHG
ncbi:hypothetical protein B0T16DRAFT_409713 [Cercophora newfieldiana]|uniref:Uncharacterized protein n=1 Tax=Cercophora newfieldiana TaxID=92897 RepID=A0AA39YD40_9PEZI|nr:hypothetical protein B0T16DRAFT_409713 [Cercophora newfieldiana]